MCGKLCAEVLIITHSYNRPELIEWQARLFKKFLQDPYRFVVFDDSQDPRITHAIREQCVRFGLGYYKIPQEIHDRPYLKRWSDEPWHSISVRCSNVIQYSLDVVGFNHNGIVVIIDSDAFLVRPFSIEKWMEGYDLAGIPQHRDPNIEYLRNDLVFMDMRTLPNKRRLDFNCGKVDGVPVDTGGQLAVYLRENTSARVRYICDMNFRLTPDIHGILRPRTDEFLDSAGFDKAQKRLLQNGVNDIDFICTDWPFLHYRGASNWARQSNEYHRTKTYLLVQYFEEILNTGE